MTIMT